MALDGSTETSQVIDEAGQAKQVLDLVKENKVMTALVVFVLWQTGTLIQVYSEIGGAICG